MSYKKLPYNLLIMLIYTSIRSLVICKYRDSTISASSMREWFRVWNRYGLSCITFKSINVPFHEIIPYCLVKKLSMNVCCVKLYILLPIHPIKSFFAFSQIYSSLYFYIHKSTIYHRLIFFYLIILCGSNQR